MKKIAKALTSTILIVGLLSFCCTFSACKSSDKMYKPNKKTSKVIKHNYKVRGNNQRNGSTYRTY